MNYPNNAISDNRRDRHLHHPSAVAREHVMPKPIRIPMATIRAHYASVRPDGHWFDRDSMRFFRTRLPRAGWLAGSKCYFVTSEQFGEAHPRRFSLRCMNWDTGDMDTVGKFYAMDRDTAADALRNAVSNGEV